MENLLRVSISMLASLMLLFTLAGPRLEAGEQLLFHPSTQSQNHLLLPPRINALFYGATVATQITKFMYFDNRNLPPNELQAGKEIIRIIESNGYTISTSTSRVDTLLDIALEHKAKKLIGWMIQNGAGEEEFIRSITTGQDSLAALLIAQGFNPLRVVALQRVDMPDDDNTKKAYAGATLLHWAAAYNCEETVSEFLQSYRGTITALVDKNGSNLLYYTWGVFNCSKYHRKAVKLTKILIDKGINDAPNRLNNMSPTQCIRESTSPIFCLDEHIHAKLTDEALNCIYSSFDVSPVDVEVTKRGAFLKRNEDLPSGDNSGLTINLDITDSPYDKVIVDH